MNINSDFSRRVLVHGDVLDWVASPMPGVDRRMLDRIGGEVARATSIVRYAPNSHFSAHTHTGGEEFVVLEGVFQDEHGEFPAGSYVRNPPTSRHTPGSDQGCIIFVKLWQFDLDDRKQVNLEMGEGLQEIETGIRQHLLHLDWRETVTYEEWSADVMVRRDLPQGGELLVLDGSLEESGDALRKQSWLRIPEGETLAARAGPNGVRIWIKTGHLPFAQKYLGSI